MSFVAEFNSLPLAGLLRQTSNAGRDAVRQSLTGTNLSLTDFANLISPAGFEFMESMAQRSQALTRQRFGKVIRLFAPLYLSNECINNCKYCGFSRDNSILRVTLSPAEVKQEADALLKGRFPEHSARVRRTSQICFQQLHGGLRAPVASQHPQHLPGSGAHGNSGLPGNGNCGCRWVGGLPGNL